MEHFSDGGFSIGSLGTYAGVLRDYNNGEPDRRSDEARNYQKYLDRVAELKASLVRNEADIAGLRREISRLNPSK